MTPDEKARAEAMRQSDEQYDASLDDARDAGWDPDPADEWTRMFWEAGLQRGAVIGAAWQRSQPVEVTKEMVEAAARMLFDLTWPEARWEFPDHIGERAVALESARAALSAALGGEER